MYYISTRGNNKKKLTSSQVILKGLASDGGLYVPENIPLMSLKEIEEMKNLSYKEKAKKIFSLFLTDFTSKEIKYCIDSAYKKNIFNSKKTITPLHKITNKKYILELFHGPTNSFKDIALQILPYLLEISMKKYSDERTYVILVATSGDTGKAALEGFKDIKKIKVLVFYPNDGISYIQKLQMITQEGKNLNVFAVRGNFDDTQTTIKNIFSNKKINNELEENNYVFNSANSINFGRLLPQIVYYFDSYLNLVKQKKIPIGSFVNFSIPTGNFGNILAGYFAKKIGLPIKTLICASNENNILTDFINTGSYNYKNRPFYKTISPSMDILISNNLERLLFILNKKNKKQIGEFMKNLEENGSYKINKKLLAEVKKIFWASYCNEKDIYKIIKKYFVKYKYLMDTHTAVAAKVSSDYYKKNKDNTPCIIISTANPYKFSKSIANIFIEKNNKCNEVTLLKEINKITKFEVPKNLKNLHKKKIHFNEVIEKKDILKKIKYFLKIK